MILSDRTLKKMIDAGGLIRPTNGTPLHISPGSVDCHLGNHFLLVEDTKMDVLTLDAPIEYREIEAQSITLPPHSFLLAKTEEYLMVPDNLTVFVMGRSSIGRMGLFVQNAGWVDPGFEGTITLELFNANSLPIKLHAGRRICQFVFCTLDDHAEHPYQGKYKGQIETVGSRIFKDPESAANQAQSKLDV